MVAEHLVEHRLLDFPLHKLIDLAAFGETKGLGGEIKLFLPPQSGETEKWED